VRWWCKDKRTFIIQKKVIRIISNAGQNLFCRNLFRDLNVLPLQCLYISEVIYYIKSNIEKMKLNEALHDHCTCHKSDLDVQFCTTTPSKNNVVNVGIKLYNKLTNKVQKLKKLQEFKRKLKYFYYNTFLILWMNICLTGYFISYSKTHLRCPHLRKFPA
jgi:hypothetical protein